MVPGSRLRSIGWAVVLAVSLILFAALTFQVNAVKSKVRLAERKIVALEQEKSMLETEFQARASQQQLANWNEVDFGYKAPVAGQFLEGERQLAMFGTPRAPGAPEPIRVASAPSDDDVLGASSDGIVAMVSPITGRAFAAELPKEPEGSAATIENLSSRLNLKATRIVLPSVQEGAE
ncbi:hypothetical protein U8326_01855 [Tsuneonella sp. CC-YZS046]|uniref:hypothetical protein n=1 Tax=Tsuneonella sp. CC-YZS046 TaxID=3042152 RepID=UPI002D7A39A2|nr:hypothetical protein [Tsuneonella sp. CC-YZS046]WRO66940.1 hypothetical protein U8326_01855 [Tsuneonella sp. CC-YZS046]